MRVILTLAGKCAFCHATGEYIDTEGVYGWRHKHPVCDLFKGALSQVKYIQPLAGNTGWEVVSERQDL